MGQEEGGLGPAEEQGAERSRPGGSGRSRGGRDQEEEGRGAGRNGRSQEVKGRGQRWGQRGQGSGGWGAGRLGMEVRRKEAGGGMQYTVCSILPAVPCSGCALPCTQHLAPAPPQHPPSGPVLWARAATSPPAPSPHPPHAPQRPVGGTPASKAHAPLHAAARPHLPSCGALPLKCGTPRVPAGGPRMARRGIRPRHALLQPMRT